MREIGTRERLYLMLNYAVEHNVRLFKEIESRFSDLAEIAQLAKAHSETAFAFLPLRAKRRLFEAADDAFLDKYTRWLTQSNVGAAIPEHPEYPALLREIADPPTVLFYRGKLVGDLPLPVAIVGTRTATDYGKQMAELFAFQLAQKGATIISGMASGIDSCAARGALRCEDAVYPTVAVLGSGIDVIYPNENVRLYDEIVERGAVITEFLPHTRPARENFPIRNRIMSGMAKGTLAVEAGERSGTSITVGCALEQGREAFAIPGRLTDVMSAGTNRMIQMGEAKPVFCAADILQEFDVASSNTAFNSGAKKIRLSSLDEDEASVCRILKNGEKSIDELFALLALPLGTLNSVLTGMQFSGIIKQLPGRLYALDCVNTIIEE